LKIPRVKKLFTLYVLKQMPSAPDVIFTKFGLQCRAVLNLKLEVYSG